MELFVCKKCDESDRDYQHDQPDQPHCLTLRNDCVTIKGLGERLHATPPVSTLYR